MSPPSPRVTSGVQGEEKRKELVPRRRYLSVVHTGQHNRSREHELYAAAG